MASIDELFGHIQSKIKAEKEGQQCYIVLRDVQDPKFNVKSSFPGAISHSKKTNSRSGDHIIVNFKTPAAAAEAATKIIPGVSITVPRAGNKEDGLRSRRDKSSSGDSATGKHFWKLLKRVKVVIRKHMTLLKEQRVSLTGHIREKAAFDRELAFLQRSLQYLHGTDNLKDQTDYFENYEEDSEVEVLKKNRVSLEIRLQEVVNQMRETLEANRGNSKRNVAAGKLKRNYYCCEKLLQYLKGQRVARVKQEVLDLAEIKEEPMSDDDIKDEPES